MIAGTVAEEALDAAALELRTIALCGLQRIEGDSLRRIERGQLEHFAARHGSNRDRVVEIHRARIARVDERLLKACLREHQHLRIDVDSEVLEQARQISGSRA